jgi:beta-glucuronidase
MKVAFLLFATAVAAVANAGGDFLTAVHSRSVRSLEGKWSYIVDPQETGFLDYRHNETTGGYFIDIPVNGYKRLIEHDFDRSAKMQIPGAWNCQDLRTFYYEGVMWFRTKFNYQKCKGRRTRLYFGAVNYESYVYLNGKKLGRHVGGFTPFDYDVTDVLVDGENSLVVKADNRRQISAVPTDIFDWWNWGGITREVLLVDLPDLHMRDVYLQAAKGNLKRLRGEISLSTAVAGEKTVIEIPELGIKAESVTDKTGTARFDIGAEPQPWSPENPKLYKVVFSHGDERVTDEIGFRTIEVVGDEIRLNGKKIFLRGACLHDEAEGAKGRVATRAEAETLIARAKKMNCNFLRLAHYPHHEYTVRAAEKAGIMVWGEIPAYWTISWDNPETLANAKAQLNALIRRDRSRANVIIWSVANETPHSDARDRFLTELVATARRADNTRLVSFAMETVLLEDGTRSLKDNLASLVDIASFNCYMGWYGFRELDAIPKIKWAIPWKKPVIVSEFGGGALAGLHGDEYDYFSEERQAAIYRANLKMYGKIKELSGLAPWILSDFRSPRRNRAQVQDGFNRKGLTDENGREKLAFQVMKSFYAEKAK